MGSPFVKATLMPNRTAPSVRWRNQLAFQVFQAKVLERCADEVRSILQKWAKPLVRLTIRVHPGTEL
jgi:hypothetical protein